MFFFCSEVSLLVGWLVGESVSILFLEFVCYVYICTGFLEFWIFERSGVDVFFCVFEPGWYSGVSILGKVYF